MASLTLASAAVKEVMSLIVSHGRQEVSLLWNFKKDLKNMEEILKTLEAVLEDAERRSVKEKAVRVWLSQLKDTCYDIEDMMDEFMLKSTKRKPQVQDDMLVKVNKIFHYPSSFVAREYLAHRMKNMRGRLNKIAETKNNFHLTEGRGFNMQEVIERRETFSACGNQSEFVGREKDKNTIVNMILGNMNCRRIPFVVAIVGFGGLGKTTLAKLIFNDKRMRDTQNFHIWSWVYVSMEFNLLNIATRVVNSFTGENVNYSSLESVSKRLRDSYRKEIFDCFR